ncbi:MAG: hypothetical protein M3Z04_14100 [Chloroflexota bacterium]|nr:hypothetical protein [Chloroflexota bacterium]
MTYHHMKPWLFFGKFFYIFSWANLGGVAAGAVIADHLTGLLPLPPQAVFLACMGLGLGATWGYQGRPFYQLALLWVGWAVRRVVAPSTLEARSSDYFPQPAPPTGGRVVLDGTLSLHRSATPGGSLPPIELLPPPAITPSPVAAAAPTLVPLPVRRVIVTNGSGPHDAEGATNEATH